MFGQTLTNGNLWLQHYPLCIHFGRSGNTAVLRKAEYSVILGYLENLARAMALTLHYHPLSSYCHKVLIALYELDIPFDANLLDSKGILAVGHNLSDASVRRGRRHGTMAV